MNEDKTTVFLYDSKYSSIPHTVVDLIIDIIHSEKDTVTIKSMAMQQQQGCDAWGMFSLAVATALQQTRPFNVTLETKMQCGSTCYNHLN